MKKLEELREQLRQEAIESDRALELCGPECHGSRHYYVGRIDAFALAITLLDNVMESSSS